MGTPQALSVGQFCPPPPHSCLCPCLSPSFLNSKAGFFSHHPPGSPSALLGGVLSVPIIQMGPQDGRRVNGGDLDEAGATTGCLTHTCSSTRGGWRFPASCQRLHPLGPGGSPYMPTTALGTQRGHSRQKSVNVLCQKQIVVFPAGLG